MFDHMNIQVTDLKESGLFYQAALVALGFKAKKTDKYMLFKSGESHFAVVRGSPSQHMHIAFKAESEREVDAFYESAMSHGGEDNGKPGPRDFSSGYYYAAFVIDPDGNNIEAAFRRGS